MRKMQFVICLLILGIWSLACVQNHYPDGLYAEISTPKGKIVIELEQEKTPMTVANFVGLAEGTLQNAAFAEGVPFFDGSTFQRVVPGHVIQGGAPNTDQSEDSGFAIPNEIYPDLSHDHAGAVGMANSGPHTANNQFYITLGDRSYLDGDYAVFGEVVEGMDVVDQIVQDDLIETVRIVRVGEQAEAFHPDDASFQKLVRAVEEAAKVREAAKLEAEAEYVRVHWPDAIATDSGWRYVVVRQGQGRLPAIGDTLTVRYLGHTASGLQFRSTGEKGLPYLGEAGVDEGEMFAFEMGTDKVTPGFDEAVAQMRKGEKRIVIVEGHSAYGESGYYAPERPGQPRFVISPRTMLVYEIEVVGF